MKRTLDFHYMSVMGLNHRVCEGPDSLLHTTLTKPSQTQLILLTPSWPQSACSFISLIELCWIGNVKMVANSEETHECDNNECGFKRIGKKLPQLGISCLKALVVHIWIYWVLQFRSKQILLSLKKFRSSALKQWKLILLCIYHKHNVLKMCLSSPKPWPSGILTVVQLLDEHAEQVGR